MRQDSVRMMTPYGGVDERALGPSTDHVGHEQRLGVSHRSRPNPSYEDITKLRAQVITEFWRYVADERVVVTELPTLDEIEENDTYSAQRAYARIFNEGMGEMFISPRWDERYVTVRLTARGRKVRR